MKRLPNILIALSLFAFGCRSESSGARLDRLAGNWNATCSILDSTSVRVTSGEIKVKQPAPNTITFAESSSMVTGFGQFGVPRTENRSFEIILKRDDSSDRYLLDCKVDSQPILKDFPLSYSESNGFSGQGTVMIDGKEQPITASIKSEGAGYVWKISSAEGSEPRRSYEFEFTEKIGDAN